MEPVFEDIAHLEQRFPNLRAEWTEPEPFVERLIDYGCDVGIRDLSDTTY